MSHAFYTVCCGLSFTGPHGARAVIRHMREHLGSGVLFQTIVTDNATSWLALYCRRAFECLEAHGWTVEDLEDL